MKSLYLNASRAYARAAAFLDPARFAFWEDCGLGMSELRTMHLLRGVPDRPIGELADEMRMRRSTMSGVVDRLVGRGLVERRDDPDDRRVVLLMLTSAGKEALEQAVADATSFLEAVFENMTDAQVRDLTRLLDVFVAGAEAVLLKREAAL